MAPFDGASGIFIKNVFQIYPSKYNHHYCNVCDDFANKFQGGAEVPMAVLFADIRGSTSLAEKIEAKEYSSLINRFYVESTNVLVQAGAMIEKLAGDEVTAIFSQGIAGENYPLAAIESAKEMLRATGHADKQGPWAPIGIGIHMGEAFIGSVGQPSGLMEVTTLGDVPNTASRLTSMAGPGEILVSRFTAENAGIDMEGLEKRDLALKGRSEKITAVVLTL